MKKDWHSFQIIRQPLYGQKPVQTVQKPGELIFVPSNAPFAFYNIDKTTVDVKTSFLGVGDVEMVGVVNELSPNYQQVFDKIVDDDDRQRMAAAVKQATKAKEEFKQTGVDVGNMLNENP